MGNNTGISVAGAWGQFELNVFKPMLIASLLQSIRHFHHLCTFPVRPLLAGVLSCSLPCHLMNQVKGTAVHSCQICYQLVFNVVAIRSLSLSLFAMPHWSGAHSCRAKHSIVFSQGPIHVLWLLVLDDADCFPMHQTPLRTTVWWVSRPTGSASSSSSMSPLCSSPPLTTRCPLFQLSPPHCWQSAKLHSKPR